MKTSLVLLNLLAAVVVFLSAEVLAYQDRVITHHKIWKMRGQGVINTNAVPTFLDSQAVGDDLADDDTWRLIVYLRTTDRQPWLGMGAAAAFLVNAILIGRFWKSSPAG